MSHSARIQALAVGHAVGMDSAGFGAVHSIFPRAVNLIIGDDLWTLLAEDKADLPFGIRLALSNCQMLGLRAGDPVSIRSGFVGVGSRLVVDCRAAPRWKPARRERAELGLERRLAVVAEAARNKSWNESAAMAQAVRSALDDSSILHDVLARVVGRGPGATPSGDDVLVGVLAVLTAPQSGAAGTRGARSLIRALVPLLPTTTEISGHMLRQSGNGLFSRDVHDLVPALIGASSLQEVSEKVRRVIESGATSGADLCEGLLAFAPRYFVADNERGLV